MALEKTIEQSTGVSATYHRILRGIADFTTGNTVLEIGSYLNAEARQAGRDPIMQWSTTVYGMPGFSEDPRGWAYTGMKSVLEWSDAKDV